MTREPPDDRRDREPQTRKSPCPLVDDGCLILLLLVALPAAVWLDLSNLGETGLRRQAADLNSVITSVRGLLCQQRRRAGACRRRARPRSSTITRRSGCHPDPGDAVARTRQGDQRATAQHHLPLRLGLSVQGPRAACAGCLRKRRVASRCATIRPEDHRCLVVDLQRPGAADCARHMGPPASAATTPTPTAPRATGRSAMSAASRRSSSPSRSPPTCSRSSG